MIKGLQLIPDFFDWNAYKQSPEYRHNCAIFEEIRKKQTVLCERYYNSFEKLTKDIGANTCRCEYSKGGGIFHRGYYSPSQLDLVVGGANRGRLLKRTPKNQNYDFAYHFDEQDRLIGVYQFDVCDDPGKMISVEVFFYQPNKVLSLGFNTVQSPCLDRISECEYENGNLICYTHSLVGFSRIVSEINMETIEYTDGLMSAFHHFISLHSGHFSHNKYMFARDENGELSTYKSVQIGFKPEGRLEYEQKAVFQVGKRK